MKKLFAILAFLFLASSAQAATYYVATTGTNSDCTTIQTVGTPALTINFALDCFTTGSSAAAGAGHTVQVAAGTYSESISNNIPSGSSGNPFTLKCATVRACTLNGRNAQGEVLSWNTGTSHSAHWVVVNGFILDGSSVAGSDGVRFSASNATQFQNITLENLKIQNMGDFGILGGSATNVTIRHNAIDDVCQTHGTPSQCHAIYIGSFSTGWIVERNDMTGFTGYGLHLYSGSNLPTNHTMRYNRIYGSTSRSGIIAYGTGHVMYNNIIYSNALDGIECAGSDCKIYNNTIYGNGDDGIKIFSTGTTVCANNMLVGNGTAIEGTCATNTTNRTTGTATDLMVDPANGNFSLKESSAAIDAGTVISGFSEGRYVGAGVDQGALEAPIRSSAVVEDATDTIYRITFSLPTQSTRDGTGLQTCTVGNIAVTVAGAGATESSCSTSASASRVDVTLGAAVTVGQALTDAYTRSTAPTLTDNVCIGDPNTTCYNAQVRTYGATAGTNNVDGGALPAFTQSRFRFHKLRGTEASPSLLNAAATENVSVTLPPGAAFRLRVKFRTDDNPDATTFKLRYSKDAGAYTDIPDTISTDNIGWFGVTGDTDIPAAGSATTELLTSDEATNVACAVVRTSSDYPLLDFNNGESECEYVLKTSTSVAVGTTYDFRVYKGDNTALDTYSVTPRLTVGNYTSFGF